jgi:hypothetical protein
LFDVHPPRQFVTSGGVTACLPKASQPLNAPWHRIRNAMEMFGMCERIKLRPRRGSDWHAPCNETRPDTGREASGSRTDGGRGFRRGSGIPEVRKRRAKVGHLHRRVAFRTSTAGNRDIPQDVWKCRTHLASEGSYPRFTPRGRSGRGPGAASGSPFSKGGMDASRAGRSGSQHEVDVVRSNAT